MRHKVLLIDRDRQMAEYIVKGLLQEDMSVDHASSGLDGLFYAQTCSYSGILLDPKPPMTNGMELLESIREARPNVPIMIVSAVSSVDAKVEALTSGADDYLTKPFAFAELVIRLKRLIQYNEEDEHRSQRLVFQDIEVDLIERRARRSRRLLDLRQKDFEMLEVLVRNKGRVLSHAELREAVWGFDDESSTNVVAVAISRLRKRMGDDGAASPIITTVRHFGYGMGVRAEEPAAPLGLRLPSFPNDRPGTGGG